MFFIKSSSFLFLVCWEFFLSWIGVGFCQVLFLHLLIWSCDLVPQPVYMMGYINWFLNIKPDLYTWDKSYLGYILIHLLLSEPVSREYSSLIKSGGVLPKFKLDLYCLLGTGTQASYLTSLCLSFYIYQIIITDPKGWLWGLNYI